MRKSYTNFNKDPRINYRGETSSRLDNLTDAVFGIAITLLIFNLVNPNSFQDLISFTKTLPAFLISITFIILIWNEHLQFSRIYGLEDSLIFKLNVIFIALIIFYVYPLKFFTIFLTNFFFSTDIEINISNDQVPFLVIYYGFVAFALYFLLWFFYKRALKIKDQLNLNSFEIFMTKANSKRLVMLFSVPLLSIFSTFIINEYSYIWASIVGGSIYNLYIPMISIWNKKFKKESIKYLEL
jgi:uncharacterized membrane protein